MMHVAYNVKFLSAFILVAQRITEKTCIKAGIPFWSTLKTVTKLGLNRCRIQILLLSEVEELDKSKFCT